MRAEWKARVRLDADVFATGEVASTEARATHNRYLAYVLEGVGVTDPALVDAMDEWRRGHNQPLGLWTAPEPDAAPALRLARASAHRVGGADRPRRRRRRHRAAGAARLAARHDPRRADAVVAAARRRAGRRRHRRARRPRVLPDDGGPPHGRPRAGDPAARALRAHHRARPRALQPLADG